METLLKMGQFKGQFLAHCTWYVASYQCLIVYLNFYLWNSFMTINAVYLLLKSNFSIIFHNISEFKPSHPATISVSKAEHIRKEEKTLRAKCWNCKLTNKTIWIFYPPQHEKASTDTERIAYYFSLTHPKCSQHLKSGSIICFCEFWTCQWIA